MTASPPDHSVNSDHIALFRIALDWLGGGHRVAVATVVQTWGSAPRPVGSHIVVREDGLFEGSVSGGCVEGAVVTDAQACLQEQTWKLLSFGIADTQAWDVGLACGGNISILIQPVTAEFFSPELMQEIIQTTGDGQTIHVSLYPDTGMAQKLDARQPVPNQHVIAYLPRARLAIVGAVHITQHLAPMAERVGYEVLIIDPRKMFAAAERMAGLTVSDAWPDDALAHWKPDAASAVVTLTHDPKLDDPALAAALKSEAFYIAALGSRKTHASRVERLKAAGFSDADVDRIHGPAGLAIGAKSPAEIALSVLAQMTAVRRRPLP